MRFTRFTITQDGQHLGSAAIREQAVNAAKGHAACTGRPVSVVAHIDGGGTKEAIFHPDGSSKKIWAIDQGRMFVPTAGEVYTNCGGGRYRCLALASDDGPVLVKFRTTEYFISIRTITRHRKSPSSFDLPRERFTELEAEGHVMVKDGHSFAALSLTDSQVRIDFTWLARYGDDTVEGFAQTVVLDYGILAQRIQDSQEEGTAQAWSMLYVDRTSQRPRLDFSSEGARRTIRDILSVPVLRHKLTRAVCDSFQWPHDGDHVIRFYADDRYSFFFREYINDCTGICGGLILHRYDGLEKAYYGVHT